MTLNADFIGLLVGLILTLCIYSYLFIGDRIPYRLAIHILVGASAAYAVVVVVRQVFEPIYQTIRESPSTADSLYLLVPILLALFLLIRRLRATSWVGNIPLALLVGVGAALAFVGALTGTLWPQLTGTYANTAEPLYSILIAVLAAVTLLSFQFTSFRVSASGIWEQAAWQRAIMWLGRGVLMITLGALFAALLNTSFILLADRINFYIQAFNP